MLVFVDELPGFQCFQNGGSLGTEGKRKGNGRDRYSLRPPRVGSRFGTFLGAHGNCSNIAFLWDSMESSRIVSCGHDL